MAGPLLETKLFVPRLRRAAVARPRLSEQLRLGSEAKLTLVSAPAGFGKTTVLAQWLASRSRCGAAGGVAVPGGGRQPARRPSGPTCPPPWTRAIPGVGADALALLASPQPQRPGRTGHHRERARRRADRHRAWSSTTITWSTGRASAPA